MMHIAWCCLEEVPYCIARSSVKFQGHTALKIVEFDPDWAFPEFTNGYEMMHKAWSSIEEVPCCFSRSSVKFQGYTALNIVEFDPNWPFPDSNSSLNTPMVTKWYTKLEVALKRCPIVFSCDQAALQMVFSVRLSVCPSVCLSVCPSHLFDYVPIIVSSWNFQELLPMTDVRSMQKVKVRGQRWRSQRSRPILTVSGL